MFEEKVETPPDSSPVTVIDPDDQPMWSSTRVVAPSPSSTIIQLPIYNNFVIKGTITMWKEMREAFVSRYFSPVKFKRLLSEIHNFHQLAHETFFTLLGLNWYSDDPTQGILDTRGIFLYNTPNEAFKILKDKVLLILDFLKSSQNNPKPKTIVFAGGSNIVSYHKILMEKFEDLAKIIDSEFLKTREELKEMRDGRINNEENHALQIFMSNDTPMCDPLEANYVQGYHGGYHDRKPRNTYSFLNHNLNYDYPKKNSHPSRYFKISKTLTEEKMREWMARQMEASEHMKNQVVELECQINQGLRRHQAIIQNMERRFEPL
ncbi:hypothetical protein Tco_0294279 [Tanacetum coccineum]